MRVASLLILLALTGCEASPTSVSLRVEGSSNCVDGKVTLLTTPRLEDGEPSQERIEATLPWEATRALTPQADLTLVATAAECRAITCTLVVDGREVARVVGTPWLERGMSTTCNWRAP